METYLSDHWSLGTLAIKIIQLTHYSRTPCSSSNFWLHFECCGHINSPRKMAGWSEETRVKSIWLIFYHKLREQLRVHYQRTALSAGVGARLCVIKNLPRIAQWRHQPRWAADPPPAVSKLILSLFFFPNYNSTACLYLAYTWPSFLFCFLL